MKIEKTWEQTPGEWHFNGNHIFNEDCSIVIAKNLKPGDARRIIACINACKGISTISLEQRNQS